MSMQRVFESARKMGVPVIVTDSSGREPFVLLPLDQFEAMAGESPARRAPCLSADRSGAVPAGRQVGRRNEDVGAQFIAPEIPLNVAKNHVEDISLEDRFYLEPAGDETMP